MAVPRLVVMLLYRPVRLMPVVFAAAVALTYLSLKLNHHNPNSHFFAPDESTFDATYSDMRKAQAHSWIADLETRIKSDAASADGGINKAAAAVPRYRPQSSSAAERPDLAVVFVTTARAGEKYLQAALGSFLSELTPQQRNRMFIAVSIGDRDPRFSDHLGHLWLHALVDEVGIREQVNITQLADYDLQSLPPTLAAKLSIYPLPQFDTKKMPTKVSAWHIGGSLDYSIALEMCGAIEAPHCLVVEDDVVFASQWYETFTKALRQVLSKYGTGHGKWGYLRFFYAEKYFGWENTEVPQIVIGIVGSVAIVVFSLILFVRFPAGQVALVREKRPSEYPGMGSYKARQSPRPSYGNIENYPDTQNPSLFGYDADRDYSYKDHGDGSPDAPERLLLPIGTVFLLGLFTLFVGILAILSGRNYIHSVPKGVSEMPTRGCCTQAIVYPLHVVTDLMDQVRFWHLERPYDININRYLASEGLHKMALNPPIVQHIGAGSSRQLVDHTYERATPLWSFAFEKAHLAQRPH